jgi:LacI family transcriptional regulator
VTSRDVAREAGVSQNTVSLVLRDSPRVREETKAAVSAAMARLGYHPSGLAAALRSQRAPGLLFVLRAVTVHHHLTAELLAGAIEAAESRGYHMVVAAVDPERRESAVDAYRAGWVGGAVVFAVSVDDPVAGDLVRAGCPTVALLQPVGACLPDRVVRADDAGGARAAVEHLVARGHRRIGLIGAPTEGNAISQDRIGAARAAASAAGVALVERHAPTWTAEAGRRAAEELLAERPRPTAIFAVSDRLAFGALAAARAIGLRVPDDLAVVGFDDTEWSRYGEPPLTTVEFPVRTIGRQGVERLLAPTPGGLAGTVPARLVVRACS